jgi:peptidoglycan-N-acetylglucosamine deacetylase
MRFLAPSKVQAVCWFIQQPTRSESCVYDRQTKFLSLVYVFSGLVVCLLLNLMFAAARAMDAGEPIKQMAITIDDVPMNGPTLPLQQMQEMNERLTGKIQANHVPAIGFVNEYNLFEKTGEVDARIALLQCWLDHGCTLGNHTFSHINLSGTPLLEYEADVIKGEVVTSKLLASKNQKLEYFRYPFLVTGSDAETKQAIQKFLAGRHYTNAPVTVSADDWMFADVYEKAKLSGDKIAMQRISDAYLSHTRAMIDYCEKMTLDVVGHPIAQIMLMHCNSLNADHFDEVISVMKDAHYQFVSLSTALQDPAYNLPDNFVGNDGIAWLQRWRFSQGKSMSFGSEPQPPQFIQDAFKEAQ